GLAGGASHLVRLGGWRLTLVRLGGWRLTLVRLGGWRLTSPSAWRVAPHISFGRGAARWSARRRLKPAPSESARDPTGNRIGSQAPGSGRSVLREAQPARQPVVRPRGGATHLSQTWNMWPAVASEEGTRAARRPHVLRAPGRGVGALG